MCIRKAKSAAVLSAGPLRKGGVSATYVPVAPDDSMTDEFGGYARVGHWGYRHMRVNRKANMYADPRLALA